MKLFSVLFCLFICASVQASQGFYRESIIDPANPLSVLDPAKRPEIERLAQNLRFFGQLGARPASDIYVHYQAIQNLLVYPQSPVTALSWMLFPISPLPTINPNNIAVSDPLGKMTPEHLGKLIAVIANGNAQLQEIYPIFIDPKKVAGFVANHKENDLKEFYRYALIDGVSKYVHRNMTPMDEDLHLTTEQQAACVAHPHLLVTAAFKSTSSHLLEIPGTEILREQNETWFTQDELETTLQLKYGGFSYRSIEKLRIQATVDMLWKSAQSTPNETLQLLTHYAWRKFRDQIDRVLLASGAIEEAQRPELIRILATPYSKADYQEIVAGVQASQDIDSFMDGLTVGESNLLLYGGARYAQIRFQDYGNVRVEHEGRALSFANCAEMSLFNLTYLPQLEEQEMSLERNPTLLPEGSLLRTFWTALREDDLSTTATKNSWTQTICRLNGVVYRKGGAQRSQWTEDSATAHWAELNPGILNQMRALFHLLGKPTEAAALTYAGSTETTIEVAALRLSQLLSGEPANGELSFEITPGEIKNLPGKKDWYGKFDIIRNGEKLADWYVDSDHSFLKLVSKKSNVFPLDKPFTNPCVIGQLEMDFFRWNLSPDIEAEYQAECCKNKLQFRQKLESLKIAPEAFEVFLVHANLGNESVRFSLIEYFAETNNPIPAIRILGGMMQVDAGREVARSTHSSLLTSHDAQRLTSLTCGYGADYYDAYSQACMNYKQPQQLQTKTSLVAENRCSSLSFFVTSVPNHSYSEMLVEDAIRVLSQNSFGSLHDVNCSFDKTCTKEDVAHIAQLLPENLKRIDFYNPISPDQFLAITTNTSECKATYSLSIDNWYRIPAYQPTRDATFADVPPTQQECAYNLLLPLAKAGHPFEPPFIELHTDEDLEPVYTQLRSVATYAQMPFAED